MTSLEPVFQTAGIRPRALWVVSTTWANALAYPLRKTIVVTERLLELLTPAELAAIVAHELGHLKEGPKAWLRLGLLWFLSGAAFIYPFIEPDDHSVFFVAAFGSFFLGAAAMRPWARQREHDADSVAMQTSDAAVYARALEKLYEANLYPATQRGGTHASLYDRLERAGITPDYPRPALPPRLSGLPAMVAAVTFVPVFAVGWPLLWQATAPDPALAAAVVTRRAHPLGELALSAWDDGNTPAAITLYRRAEELDPSSPWYPRNLAAVLNEVGDCKAAAAALQRARANTDNDQDVATSLFTIECDEGASVGDAEP
jgi:Zn-dependent protease with chaperone function